MKKNSGLLAIVFFALLFTSCKKDDTSTDSTDYFMSAKVDGTLKTYKVIPYAIGLV